MRAWDKINNDDFKRIMDELTVSDFETPKKRKGTKKSKASKKRF